MRIRALLQRLTTLYRYRELLYVLAGRDIRIRYKQTAMGFLWALVLPASVVLAGVVVRALIRGEGFGGETLAGLIVKSIPWAFFTSALKNATQSLIGNTNLVSKVAFPKEVFPVAAIVVAGLDLLVSAGVAAIILVFLLPGATAWLLAIPLLLVIILAFVLGLGLALAALNLFFRDIKYIVDVVLTFAIFFTPVLYDASMLGQYEPLVMLNPLAAPLGALTEVVVDGQLRASPWLTYSAVVSFATLAMGYRLFTNLEYKFAESI